ANQAVLAVEGAHDGIEEAVEEGDNIDRWPTLGERGRPHDIDEQHADVPLLALETHTGLESPASDLLAHVPAEHLPQSLPFPQTARHVIEPGLEEAQFTVVVDGDFGVELTAGYSAHRQADVGHRIGNRPG